MKTSDEEKVLHVLEDKIYGIYIVGRPHFWITREDAITMARQYKKDASYIYIWENGEWSIWDKATMYYGG